MSTTTQTERRTNGKLLVAAVSAVIGAILSFSAVKIFGEKVPKFDSDVLAVALSVVSLLVGWWVSKYYSEQSATRNLRDYGVQVARGVMVMQSHVRQLQEYVVEKRGLLGSNDATVKFDLQLEHVQHTLTGLLKQADASLSGIARFIGDELKQHDDVLAQINTIRSEAVANATKLLEQGNSGDGASQNGHGTTFPQALGLIRSLEEIDRVTSEKIAALSKSASLPVFENPSRLQRSVIVACPHCNHSNTVLMIDSPGQTKVTDCANCQQRFNVHLSAAGLPFARSPAPKLRQSNPSGWSSWSLPFHPADFGVLANMLSDAGNELKDPMLRTPNALINACASRYVTREDGSPVDETVKRGFANICWYGRLFTFASSAPGLAEIYSNQSFSRKDVLAAIARYAGHKLGQGRADINALLAPSLVKGIVCADASDEEVQVVIQNAADGYAKALGTIRKT